MIEIVHNPDRLSCRKSLLVSNPRLAYERLEAVMASKRPRGMRLRHSLDLPTSTIFLEARNTLPIETIVTELQSFITKVIS